MSSATIITTIIPIIILNRVVYVRSVPVYKFKSGLNQWLTKWTILYEYAFYVSSILGVCFACCTVFVKGIKLRRFLDSLQVYIYSSMFFSYFISFVSNPFRSYTWRTTAPAEHKTQDQRTNCRAHHSIVTYMPHYKT